MTSQLPRRRLAHASFAAAVLAGAVLFRFPPAQNNFYPECPIHRLLGVQCPGCGATRALAALLHGRLTEALHANTLFVLLLPIALLYALILYHRALASQAFRWPQLPPAALSALSAAAILFTIARNL